MARRQGKSTNYTRPVRNILVGFLLFALLAIFLLWRIDNPRVERFRAYLVDQVVPNLDWVLLPVTKLSNMVEGFQSYQHIYEQNQELRRELQQMKAWKEAALQLEQENAKLLDLNNVRLDPKLTYVTGVVLADSGTPFRQSVLLNVGKRDGIIDGWAATDGLGLVGRIAGVGQNSSRVILLTDGSSRIPVTIQPAGQKGILSGDNTSFPLIEFVEDPGDIRAGDRVVSSGDGGVFPPGLLVGNIVRDADQNLRVALSAEYARLEFLRVLRSEAVQPLTSVGELLDGLPDPAPDDERAEGENDG